MSSVMRPSGPLPARTYWLRRLLVVAVVMLVVALVWWVLDSRASGSQSAGSPKPDASLSGVSTTRPASAAPSATTDTASPRGSATGHQHLARSSGSRSAGRRTHPQPQSSTGMCSPTDVDIAVSGADAKVGQSMMATLSLTTLDGAVCTLQITPGSMVLRVASEANVVWTSDDCPNLLPARQVVVRPAPATTYRWTWDGRRSVQGCASPGAVATPGSYEVEAALVGADVHKGAFRITR